MFQKLNAISRNMKIFQFDQCHKSTFCYFSIRSMFSIYFPYKKHSHILKTFRGVVCSVFDRRREPIVLSFQKARSSRLRKRCRGSFRFRSFSLFFTWRSLLFPNVNTQASLSFFLSCNACCPSIFDFLSKIISAWTRLHSRSSSRTKKVACQRWTCALHENEQKAEVKFSFWHDPGYAIIKLRIVVLTASWKGKRARVFFTNIVFPRFSSIWIFCIVPVTLLR